MHKSRSLRWLTLPCGILALVMGNLACSSDPEEDGADEKRAEGPAAGLCASGQAECTTGCADLSSDPLHCGACELACGDGLLCSLGQCAASCGAGQTQCGAACADLNTSPSHCGACDNGCAAGQVCSSGACEGAPAGSGGASSTGGASGTGGNPDPGPVMVGPCNNTVGQCSAPEVRVTEIDFGVPLTDYGSEYDTLPLPAALSAIPSGGTRVAARGADGQIHVATLDCDDNMVGQPFAIPAVDLQDIHSDDDGGVVLLTRDANGSGEHNCGVGPLCGGESAPCYDSYLVRFDNGGNELWATRTTNLGDGLDGYNNGARFVWNHYQHHGRIAFDGSNYATYFCIGITVDNNACVDIHQGDRFEVIGADGTDVDHPQEMAVGCSHSWTTRTVWDPRSNEFMMTCATDNPDPGTGFQCRVRHPPTNTTIAPIDCTGQFWQGDLVLAEGSGYWSAYNQNGATNLVHFTKDGGPDDELANVADSDHAKLVRFAEGKMLLAWESGEQMAAQILDATDGSPIGSEFSIAVEDHNYHAFKEFPDGSVAYPAAGSSETSLRIARVMPCN